MKLYNHAFTIAFTIENTSPTGEVTEVEVLSALQERVDYLKNNPQELLESVGAPFDTYEVD